MIKLYKKTNFGTNLRNILVRRMIQWDLDVACPISNIGELDI